MDTCQLSSFSAGVAAGYTQASAQLSSSTRTLTPQKKKKKKLFPSPPFPVPGTIGANPSKVTQEWKKGGGGRKEEIPGVDGEGVTDGVIHELVRVKRRRVPPHTCLEVSFIKDPS